MQRTMLILFYITVISCYISYINLTSSVKSRALELKWRTSDKGIRSTKINKMRNSASTLMPEKLHVTVAVRDNAPGENAENDNANAKETNMTLARRGDTMHKALDNRMSVNGGKIADAAASKSNVTSLKSVNATGRSGLELEKIEPKNWDRDGYRPIPSDRVSIALF